jgi:hypothetical protein
METAVYNAWAAINAYFSWLEHILVLSFAFTRQAPGQETLLNHIRATWSGKFRGVFGTTDQKAVQLLGTLSEIAETYRNTYAHGGFDKGRATLFIHIDGIGSVPATLTDFRRSPHFELYPFTPESFDAVSSRLDEVDTFLEQGRTRFAMRWIRSGLDVPFDKESRRQFTNAMKSEERFEALVRRRCDETDRYLNMEF